MSNASSASKSISSMFSSIRTTSCSGRRQPGQDRQGQDRHVRLLAQQGQAVVQAPERGREAGVDQADPCHWKARLGRLERFADWRRGSTRRWRSGSRIELVTSTRDGSPRDYRQDQIYDLISNGSDGGIAELLRMAGETCVGRRRRFLGRGVAVGPAIMPAASWLRPYLR